jgi:hypothetical protein
MGSLCRISEDASDANIVSWPAPMAQEVLIAKNKKKRNITGKIHPLTAAFGDLGHFPPEPMESSRSVLSVSIG